jgi:hypothetical protein
MMSKGQAHLQVPVAVADLVVALAQHGLSQLDGPAINRVFTRMFGAPDQAAWLRDIQAATKEVKKGLTLSVQRQTTLDQVLQRAGVNRPEDLIDADLRVALNSIEDFVLERLREAREARPVQAHTTQRSPRKVRVETKKAPFRPRRSAPKAVLRAYIAETDPPFAAPGATEPAYHESPKSTARFFDDANSLANALRRLDIQLRKDWDGRLHLDPHLPSTTTLFRKDRASSLSALQQWARRITALSTERVKQDLGTASPLDIFLFVDDPPFELPPLPQSCKA